MDINDFIESLDFEENNYFYHMTQAGKSERIMEEGLKIVGRDERILNDDILHSTVDDLTIDMVSDIGEFKNMLSMGTFPNSSRLRAEEMVIIGAPKSDNDTADLVDTSFVSELNDGNFQALVNPEYILGYIDIDRLEFIPNHYYNFTL